MTGGTPSTGPEPVGGHRYRVGATASAGIDAVWPLIGQARRWSDWSFLTRSVLERDGSPDPDGVGAVRHFTRYGIGSREEVVAWDPPHHLGYRILSGFPVRNYRADVTLTSEGSGTRIDWAGTFDPKIPASGRILDVVLPAMMQRFADAVARYADGMPPSD